MGFYVTVTSSEPCEFYKNTWCDFKNYFPTPIQGQRLEVALCSISYIYSSTIIQRGTVLGYGQKKEEMKARPNIASLQDLAKQIEDWKRKTPDLTKVVWTTEFSSLVDTISGRFVFKSEDFYSGLSEMNIFSANIEPERFGSGMRPLLRSTLYTPNRQGAPVQETFSHLQYKRVSGGYLDSIHIYIRNELDLPLPLESGRVTAVLHFQDAIRH
jgi:hypothetical protein